MADSSADNLLVQLAGRSTAEGPNPWATVAARKPDHQPKPPVEKEKADARLDELLRRVKGLTQESAEEQAGPTASGPTSSKSFCPVEPSSFQDAHLTSSEVESLILKVLLSRGDMTGRNIADQLKLPFLLLDELLRQIKLDQLVFHKGAAPMNDYTFQLTDLGRERARRLNEHCSYFGAAPVSLRDYIASVSAQSLTTQRPSQDDLRRAFSDLLINQNMLRRLGPAINSGRGLFLFGSPGNGKTSIAQRVTRVFGQAVWIPRAISIDGEVIRIYDPMHHEEMPLDGNVGLLDQGKIDKRWIRIRRPTIVVGGELTMENLEITLNTATGIHEAPVQLKSNCGTLVIDDFGRQRMRTDELLNRWILPLESRHDFLNLASGKRIQVPFDQLIIFSTNLEPKDLVDDAFLRRIPYKIEVLDPTEHEFRELLKIMAPSLGFEYNEETATYLIEKHYKAVNRPFRCCQPRDLLLQVRNYCSYHNQTLAMTSETMDFAVENYFAVM